MREIIAFIGRAGSGKDYQCSLLSKKGFKKVAFADTIREITAELIGLKLENMLEFYDKFKSSPVICNCVTGREVMERVGSAIRKVEPDFFINALYNKINSPLYREHNICISDMRFLSEYMFFSNKLGFKAVFCDYHSSRYNDCNTLESARLANVLYELGYKDLQEIKKEDMIRVKEIIDGQRKAFVS